MTTIEKDFFSKRAKSWLNEHRPDLFVSESLLNNICDSIQPDIEDLDLDASILVLVEYLSLNYNLELFNFIDSLVEEMYPQDKIDLRNIGIYGEELESIVTKAINLRLGEEFDFNLITHSPEYTEEAVAKMREIINNHVKINWR